MFFVFCFLFLFEKFFTTVLYLCRIADAHKISIENSKYLGGLYALMFCGQTDFISSSCSSLLVLWEVLFNSSLVPQITLNFSTIGIVFFFCREGKHNSPAGY